ncbi:hypothetical protein ACFSTC_58435 [Nonomuraea ferruginea]
MAVAGDSESHMLARPPRRLPPSWPSILTDSGHSRDRLVGGGATHVLPSVGALPELILSGDLGGARIPAPVR